MPPPTVRTATRQDIPAMLAIYAPYVADTPISFETQVPSPEEFAARFENTTAFFPWLVCEAAGAVTGYAYATRFGVRGGYSWSAETSVYIQNNRRGAGAGRRLYNALCPLLAAQGFYTLYARIVSPNAPSEGFHTACGFAREAVLQNVGCKFGQFLNVAYYKKVLRPYAENPAQPVPFAALAPTQAVQIIAAANAGPL